MCWQPCSHSEICWPALTSSLVRELWKNGRENASVNKTSNVAKVMSGLVPSDPIFQMDNKNTCIDTCS